MSDFGLAERLEIPVYQAREFIESYFRKYPNVKKFMNETIAKCQEDGYVTTMLNRRRDIPEIKSTNHSLKEFGKRAAMTENNESCRGRNGKCNDTESAAAG